MKNRTSDFRSHYLEIKHFLNSRNSIWNYEVIQHGSASISCYPAHWADCIMSLDTEKLFRLSTDSRRHTEYSLPSDLHDFLERISFLASTHGEVTLNISENGSHIPPYSLPKVALQNLTPKKSYELTRVFGALLKYKLLPHPSSVIDFCGGAGYAARTLAHFMDTPTVSVDNDQDLQKRGEQRTRNYIPKHPRGISFITRDLLLDDYNYIKDALPLKAPIIGIHTCAHLSDIQLKLARDLNSPWTLNIGCCYFKTKDNSYQLSDYAKSNVINYSDYALYLATRGQEYFRDGFETSVKVKLYRFMLHLFLESEFSLEFLAVGSSPMTDYQLEFQDYALSRLNALAAKKVIPHVPGRESLHLFSIDPRHEQLAKRMWACNYIRSFFSRLLELTITLDRAIFMEEAGYNVELIEIFDPMISPRNLAILGFH